MVSHVGPECRLGSLDVKVNLPDSFSLGVAHWRILMIEEELDSKHPIDRRTHTCHKYSSSHSACLVPDFKMLAILINRSIGPTLANGHFRACIVLISRQTHLLLRSTHRTPEPGRRFFMRERWARSQEPDWLTRRLADPLKLLPSHKWRHLCAEFFLPS